MSEVYFINLMYFQRVQRLRHPHHPRAEPQQQHGRTLQVEEGEVATASGSSHPRRQKVC